MNPTHPSAALLARLTSWHAGRRDGARRRSVSSAVLAGLMLLGMVSAGVAQSDVVRLEVPLFATKVKKDGTTVFKPLKLSKGAATVMVRFYDGPPAGAGPIHVSEATIVAKEPGAPSSPGLHSQPDKVSGSAVVTLVGLPSDLFTRDLYFTTQVVTEKGPFEESPARPLGLGGITEGRDLNPSSVTVGAGGLTVPQGAAQGLVLVGDAAGVASWQQLSGAGLAVDSVTSAQVASGAIGSEEILDRSIQFFDLAEGAVGQFELGNGAVTTTHLTDGAVTTVKIAAGAVTSDKLAGNSVGSGALQAGSVTSTAIQDGSISLGDIQGGVIPHSGGSSNSLADGITNFIGGGTDNTVFGGARSSVVGGMGNIAGHSFNVTYAGAVVAGGRGNGAQSIGASILGGYGNNVNGGYYSTIGGGTENKVIGHESVIAGGDRNTLNGNKSHIGGGVYNFIGGYACSIGGGRVNSSNANFTWIGGGYGNQTDGAYSAVAGGLRNRAEGRYSFAAGREAAALHDGAFVWGDASEGEKPSLEPNSFTVYAEGGTRFYSDREARAGAVLAPGSGTWSQLSDVGSKENIAPVDTRAVLDKLLDVPVATWNYKTQPDHVLHMGPMAQDFHAAFALGVDERHIDGVDPDGVAFAAIQGLAGVVREKEVVIGALEHKVEALEARLEELMSRLDAVSR